MCIPYGCLVAAGGLLGMVFGGGLPSLAIAAADFHQALGQSVFFRTFVFSGFADRLSGVIGRMEELLEGDIDRMLARARRAAHDGKVEMTHQDLAIAIGSAREVVSRHLKRLESREWVKLSRGSIELSDEKALHALALGS